MEAVMEENYQLFQGDCLEVMDELIKQGIKVDCIITDPPYGTTSCRWDSIIPFEEMWKRLDKLVKDDGVIVLFGSQPFSAKLICSNLSQFRYEWIWQKNKGSNFSSLKYQPFKEHENILVFSKDKKITYNPIFEERTESGKKRCQKPVKPNTTGSQVYNMKSYGKAKEYDPNLRHPKSVQKFNCETGFHPTQKPVALLEYLIKTYTNEGELVLDFTMGSGSTGVACINVGRNFIGIELDDNYFDIAKNRIAETQIHKTNEENKEDVCDQ